MSRIVEIDLDVHKLIEAERRSFAETRNDILRRLLGLDEPQGPPTALAAREAEPPAEDGRSWAGKGVVLPHGTRLMMEYNGQLHEGVIKDGRWLVDGARYGSPSAAAKGVARSKAGNRVSLDGWLYWKVLRPNDRDWTPLTRLRHVELLDPETATL